MKRLLLWASLLVLTALAAASVYTAAAQEREFRRLVAEGEAALAEDRTFLAIEAFSGAIALKPDSMLAYLRRGETYRRRGDLGAALRDLRAADRLDPGATRPLEQLGDVNYALGRYERAAERYESYIRLDDRSPRVLYKLALARYRHGRRLAAIPALRQAVGLNDRFAEAYYLLGLCLRDERRSTEAVEALERAVRLAPGFTPPRDALADLYAALDRPNDAVQQLEALAALDPSRPERRIALGLAHARYGRTEAAIVTLGRVAERFPDDTNVYLALGRVWLQSAETRKDRVALNKALEALEEVARRAAPTSDGLALYGRALLLSGDAAGAERTLQQAAERRPVEPAALRDLALAAQRLGHLPLARDALIRYLALRGDARSTADPAVRLADLSLRLREPGEAARWLRHAIDVSSPTPLLLARLGDAERLAGHLDAARAAIARGLALDPMHPRLLELRRLVEARR